MSRAYVLANAGCIAHRQQQHNMAALCFSNAIRQYAPSQVRMVSVIMSGASLAWLSLCLGHDESAHSCKVQTWLAMSWQQVISYAVAACAGLWALLTAAFPGQA